MTQYTAILSTSLASDGKPYVIASLMEFNCVAQGGTVKQAIRNLKSAIIAFKNESLRRATPFPPHTNGQVDSVSFKLP